MKLVHQRCHMAYRIPNRYYRPSIWKELVQIGDPTDIVIPFSKIPDTGANAQFRGCEGCVRASAVGRRSEAWVCPLPTPPANTRQRSPSRPCEGILDPTLSLNPRALFEVHERNFPSSSAPQGFVSAGSGGSVLVDTVLNCSRCSRSADSGAIARF